jgi:hypothetical protein
MIRELKPSNASDPDMAWPSFLITPSPQNALFLIKQITSIMFKIPTATLVIV